MTPTIDKQRQFLVISRMVQTGFLIFSVAASSENEVVPSYIIVIQIFYKNNGSDPIHSTNVPQKAK